MKEVNGIDVSECKYKFQDKDKFNGKKYCTLFNELCSDVEFVCDKNCQVYEDYKQLARLQEENEELKKKIKDLDAMTGIFSVRLANKYKQALEEIREDLEQDTTCESRECGCDDYGECLKCVKETMLDKINEALNDRD